MGYYKNESTNRSEVRRFNAAQRRADKLKYGGTPSRLISLETVSETERFSMAQDAERLTAFNKDVEDWQNRVTAQLRTIVGTRSQSIAAGLIPRSYKDKYGIINRLGFSFPRHGIYLHYGAWRGHGGTVGSKWTKHKYINNVKIDTGILRHTNPDSVNNQMGIGERKAFPWFDPIIRSRIEELADISTRYFDTMVVDATRIYIQKQ